MKFGCCTGTENAALLKQAGYDYIELGVSSDLKPLDTTTSPVVGIRDALTSAKLPVEAFNVFVPGSLKITGPDRDLDKLVDYVAVAAKRASELGGKVIVFGSGGARQVPAGFDFDDARGQIVEFLNAVSDILKPYGLLLAIEPLQKAECNIINSVDDGVDIVNRVGRTDVVNVLSDLFHVFSDGQSFDETANAGHLLKHVHIALGTDRHPPTSADTDELTSYFRAVKASGYDSRISIEAHWTDIESDAEQALVVMKSCWANAQI